MPSSAWGPQSIKDGKLKLKKKTGFTDFFFGVSFIQQTLVGTWASQGPTLLKLLNGWGEWPSSKPAVSH